jgi:hypothetical protein
MNRFKFLLCTVCVLGYLVITLGGIKLYPITYNPYTYEFGLLRDSSNSYLARLGLEILGLENEN